MKSIGESKIAPPRAPKDTREEASPRCAMEEPSAASGRLERQIAKQGKYEGKKRKEVNWEDGEIIYLSQPCRADVMI